MARRGPVAWIHLDDDGRPVPYVQVAADVAHQIAKRVRVGGRNLLDQPPALQEYYTARAIGRSIAHEIGHYLRASREHADVGLMRAVIPFSELMTSPDTAFLLDARTFSCTCRADAVPIGPVVR